MKKRHFPWTLVTGPKYGRSSLLLPSLLLTAPSLRLGMGHPIFLPLDWPWLCLVSLGSLQKVLFKVLFKVLICACLTPCSHK